MIYIISMKAMVEIQRPVQGDDGTFEKQELPPFPLSLKVPDTITLVTGTQPLAFIEPLPIALDTNNYLEILQLLEYAGVHYLSPNSPAAAHGLQIFTAARQFAIDSAPEWVGFDWDFTTNIYRVYGPLLSLIVVKLLHSPPLHIQNKSIRLFEAPKPGIYELIFGMAVGYALRQGLRNFNQWEYYQPHVRWVTQTWRDRLAKLGTGVIRLIPLMMGRYPGIQLNEEDIRNSDAFITIEDFFERIKAILGRFMDSNFQFHALAEREQNELMEQLKAGDGYKLKLLSTFTAKGWMPPQLIFDDSPASNARMLKEGVRVVSTLNPLMPGKEVHDINVLSFWGKKVAAKKMLKMASYTEGPAMLETLKRLAAGEVHIRLEPHHLVPVPEGTVLELNDLSGPLAQMLLKFKTPQREIKEMIRTIIRKAGGLDKIEAAYKLAAALRRPSVSS